MEPKKPVLELINTAKKPTGKKPTHSGGTGGGGDAKTPQTFGDYLIKNGAFHQQKAVRSGADGSGMVEFPLCDFTCQIVEEVIADDGLTETNLLRIEGRRQDGLPLPLVDVPAKSFYALQGNWTNEHWGAVPFIYPGASKKDNLRACIHLYSRLKGDIPRRTVYKYTGWKKLNSQWHYLTGSGAITAAGLVAGTDVDLDKGHMNRYRLPEPLTGDALSQAATAALLLLQACPGKPHIGASLLAAVARAPLGECHPTDFVIWLHGLTGSGKSELAAIALAFFGEFTARSFPANWSDSINDSEAKAHQAKDAVFVVDDFKPSVSQGEAAKLHAAAERFIRNTGNQAGRGRRDGEMRAKAAPYNRSLSIGTGEDRGVAIFAKACFGHPSPSKQQKLNATANAFGAPIRPRHPVPTRQGVGT